MKYILMHKETPVVSLDIDKDVCAINKIEEIYNEAHLPVGVHIINGIVDFKGSEEYN